MAKEMEWVVRTFRHMEEVWERRVKKMEEDEKLGHRAHAAREKERWHRWAERAKAEFTKELEVERFME